MLWTVRMEFRRWKVEPPVQRKRRDAWILLPPDCLQSGGAILEINRRVSLCWKSRSSFLYRPVNLNSLSRKHASVELNFVVLVVQTLDCSVHKAIKFPG